MDLQVSMPFFRGTSALAGKTSACVWATVHKNSLVYTNVFCAAETAQ